MPSTLASHFISRSILLTSRLYNSIVFCNYNWYVSIWSIKFVSPLTTRISVISLSPARRPWCSNSQTRRTQARKRVRYVHRFCYFSFLHNNSAKLNALRHFSCSFRKISDSYDGKSWLCLCCGVPKEVNIPQEVPQFFLWLVLTRIRFFRVRHIDIHHTGEWCFWCTLIGWFGSDSQVLFTPEQAKRQNHASTI